MIENVRCESNQDKKDILIESKKLNCKKLVYNKKLSSNFKLYLTDRMAYKKAFDLLTKKTYIYH